MRYLVIAAALAAGSAMSQDSFLTGEALEADVKAACSDGCVVFNRERVESLMQAIKQMAGNAYAEGKKEGNLSCRNAI